MEKIVLTLHEFGLHKTINEYSNPFHKKRKKKARKRAAPASTDTLTIIPLPVLSPTDSTPTETILDAITADATPNVIKGKLKLRLKDRSIKIMR